ncbi:MAG: hypothetical protein ACRDLZ_10445 [Gaiellaceae bacterium]
MTDLDTDREPNGRAQGAPARQGLGQELAEGKTPRTPFVLFGAVGLAVLGLVAAITLLVVLVLLLAG